MENRESKQEYGPLAQLVRAFACHAKGRRFESDMGRMTIYYSPEQYGLETIGSVEWDDEPYSFNMTAVWQDSDGLLYWADDQGCSCPSPFEGMTIADLNTGTKYDLALYLDSRREDRASYGYSNLDNADAEIVELLSRI